LVSLELLVTIEELKTMSQKNGKKSRKTEKVK